MLAEGSARSFQAQVPRVAGRGITLEVLRSEGADALSTHGVEGLLKARLRRVAVTYENSIHQTDITDAMDVLKLPHDTPGTLPIPRTGVITEATVLLEFADSNKPIPVDLRLPNIIIFPEDGHANHIQRWVATSHFVQNPNQDGAGDFSTICETPGDHSKNFPA